MLLNIQPVQLLQKREHRWELERSYKSALAEIKEYLALPEKLPEEADGVEGVVLKLLAVVIRGDGKVLE